MDAATKIRKNILREIHNTRKKIRNEYKNILITIIVFLYARYYFLAYSMKKKFLKINILNFLI